MKWYKTNYVNRRDWIIDHYEFLNLSAQEGIVCLAIDFLMSKHLQINYDILAKKTNLDLDTIDEVLSILVAKKFLEIRATAKGVEFHLDGLFEHDGSEKVASVNSSSVFDIFEQSFGRPLSAMEAEKINDWLTQYDSKILVYALKEAVIYEKLSLPYIEAILRQWSSDPKKMAKLKSGK